MARVPWLSLAPVHLLAEVAWSGGLVLAGFYLGDYLAGLQDSLQTLAAVGGAASMVTLGLPLVKFAAASLFKSHQATLIS